MTEDILNVIKDAFLNIYFIPIILIGIVGIIIKNIIDYKKYLKTCEIFGQEPKKSGYIKNSIIQVFGIITISIVGFIGYEGLNNSQRFVEKFENKKLREEKNIVKKPKPIKEKKTDIQYSVNGEKVEKRKFFENTKFKNNIQLKDQHQIAKENLLKQMQN